MFIEINGLAYNLMFTQSIDKLYEDGKYKILYAISNENKLVEEFDNEVDRDAKYEKAQAVGGASKEEIEHIEDEIEHLKEVGFHPLKVDELPTEDIKDYILYLVPSDKPGENNLCYEYLYINNAWEMVGTTSVDLSNYYTKDEVDDRSMFNIVLPNSTLEGNGNIRQEDYQAFLPLLQFLYTKCRGTNRFIRLPFVNINTAHDSSTFYDADNSQLFVVDEQYNKSLNNIHVSLNGIPKFDNSGVAKYFSLYVDGNIENDNITSIRSVSIHKSTLPVATKKYVDDVLANIDVSFDDVYVVTCGHRFDGGSFNITDDGSITEMMNTYWPKYLANSNQGGLVIWKDYTGATNGTTLIGYMRGTEIYIQWPWAPQANGFTTKPYGSVGVVTITGSWDSNTETYTLTKAVWNRTNYVPTKDWNPANKKYVDDNKYVLPIASVDTLGGIKLGKGLSADENGVVSASGGNDLEIRTINIPYDIKSKISFGGGVYLNISDKDWINETNKVLNEIYQNQSTKKYLILFKDTTQVHGFKIFDSIPAYNSSGERGFSTTLLFNCKYGDGQSIDRYYRNFFEFDLHFYTNITDNIVDIDQTKLTTNYNLAIIPQTYSPGKGDGYRAIYLTNGAPLGIYNQSSYTPTKDYHPATKKYVDDSINNISTLPIIKYEDGYEDKIVELINKFKAEHYPEADNINNTGFAFILQGYTEGGSGPSTYLISLNATYTSSSNIYLAGGYAYRDDNGYIGDVNTAISVSFLSIVIGGAWADGVFTKTSFTIKKQWDRIFGQYNDVEWTPDRDYGIVNKKYVDDSISSAITDALGGSY